MNTQRQSLKFLDLIQDQVSDINTDSKAWQFDVNFSMALNIDCKEN
jgi:recombination associated protein RdgC